MNWNSIVDKIKPHLAIIKTQNGIGTGFLCIYGGDGETLCGIATASHVIHDAHEWNLPIQIKTESSQAYIFLKHDERVIFEDPKRDSAIIIFLRRAEMNFPDKAINLRPLEKSLEIGVEVGWIGYPYLEENTPCFFSGCISAKNLTKNYYLMDGVAINGVSGGPVLYSTETDGLEIIGIISAYMANRSTGSTLPGLSIAQDVSHLISIASGMKNLDDAKKQSSKQIQKPEEIR